MSSWNYLISSVRNQSVSKTGKQNIIKRLCVKIGISKPKDVQECSGKTLQEIAELTSRKDTIHISNQANSKIINPVQNIRVLQCELREIRTKIKKCKYLLNGGIDDAIAYTRSLIRDVAIQIRMEKPYKANSSSLNGRVGTMDESAAHFKYRISNMKEADLYPLQRKLEALMSQKKNLPNEMRQLMQAEKEILEKIATFDGEKGITL